MSTAAKRVLLTGAAGGVARCVGPALREAGMFVRGLDCVSVPSLVGRISDEWVTGDIAESGLLESAAEGVDAIIHLAANARGSAEFVNDLLAPNVVGMIRLFEAARVNQVPRVVIASTCQVMTAYDGPLPASVDVAAPKNHYGLTKLWAESAGRMHAQQTGASVLAVRIGWYPCNPEIAQQIQRSKGKDRYISTRDCGELFVRSITADFEGYHTIYGFGRPAPGTEPTVDFEPGARLIGFRPEDTWPEGVPESWLASD